MKALMFTLPLLLCSAATKAETVGWWRFDDEAPGTKSTATSRAANAVSPDYGTGTFNSITGTGAGSLGTDEGHMPKFVQASSSVYDPVTDTYYDNASAVKFVRTGSTSDTIEGGAVIVPNASQLKPGSLTIECFIKTSATVYNTFMPIFGRTFNGDFTSESFALYVTSDGKLGSRVHTGSTTYLSGTSGIGTHPVNNGAWHHVALTYNGSTGETKVYVDRALDFTISGKYTYRDDVRYPSDSDSLWIGGYRYAGRKFDGEIDEVRLSNAVLEPESFLRLQEPPQPVADEDTLFFASFEGLSGDLAGRNLNLIPNGKTMTVRTTVDVGTPVVTTNSIPGPRFCAGANAAACVENRRSLYLPKSANGCGYSLQCPNAAYTRSSLTVECFIRCDKPIGSDFTESQKIFQFGNNELALVRTHDGQFYALYHQNGLWISGVNDSSISDGKWHHVAVVYDKEMQTVTFCLDYTRSATASNVTTVDAVAHNLYIGADSADNNKAQHFHGAIDGLRITQRALTSAEFLNRGGIIDEVSSTVVNMSFENDYLVGPVPYLSGLPDGYGQGYAVEGGAFPTFTADVPAALVSRDGRAQTVVVTNTAALRVEKGYAVFPQMGTARDEDFTAECFCRFRTAKAHTGIMSMRDGESLTSAADWALCFGTDTVAEAEAYNSIRLILTDANGTTHNQNFTLPKSLKGDVWHHLALTGEKDGDSAVLVTLYCDYRKVGETRLAGRFRRNSTRPWIVLGGFSRTGYNEPDDVISADFDEVRVSNRALLPAEFLRAYREKKILLLIVR